MNKLKLRVATPQRKTTQALRVDRKNLIVYGVTTMQQGVEALGHGVMTDAVTLEQTMKLVNDRQRPVIGRLGHPGMSENASGKQFYTVKDARIDSVSGNLVADLHLMEPARVSPAFGGDVIDWFMDMAEQHAGEIALSYVLAVNPVWTFADGREEPTNPFYPDEDDGTGRPEDALTPLPLARVEGVYYLDTVTEGAVTHAGLFQAWEGTSNETAEQLFEALDEFRAQYGVKLSDIPRKANQLALKYVASRGYSKPNLEEAEMQLEDKEQPTVEATDAAPEVVQPDPLDAALAEANADAESATPNEDASADAAPTAEPEAAPANADLSVELAETKAELAVALQSLADLRGELAAFGETLAKISQLSVLNQQNIGSVSKRVGKLEGEPVVSASIGGSKAKFSAPPTNISKPVHMSERKGGTAQPEQPKTPEQASLATFNRRSQMRQNLGTTRSAVK